MNYSIDSTTHRFSGNRHDGFAIDGRSFSLIAFGSDPAMNRSALAPRRLQFRRAFSLVELLPYIEQAAMHDMGAGLAQPQKYAAHLQRMAIPLSVLYCPSRRKAVAYPWNQSSGAGGATVANAGMPTVVGRTDYACNGGDFYV